MNNTTVEHPTGNAVTPEYEAGRQAHAEGRDLSANPHRNDDWDRMMDWNRGWYNSHYERRAELGLWRQEVAELKVKRRPREDEEWDADGDWAVNLR
jgi:hypothetical protein